MTITSCLPAHTDNRGVIRDILKDVPVENISTFSSKKGSKRGNHYHKEATVFVYVMMGSFKVYARSSGNLVMTRVVHQYDMVEFQPYETHTLVALEDSIYMLFAHGPRGGPLTVQDLLV